MTKRLWATILATTVMAVAPAATAGPPAGPPITPSAGAPGRAPAPVAAPAPAQARTVVNGQPMTPAQVQAFTQTYGMAPQPGNYWYDARSGLFGYVGQGAMGAMRPGHAFGSLAPAASNGRTGVFINGRQVPASELVFYQRLVGAVAPGRYWMDGYGNVGYEGVPQPLVNLVAVMASAGIAPAPGAQGGAQWSGEANLGGYWPMTSGTWDTSGGGNHVFSVDGEVLTLP